MAGIAAVNAVEQLAIFANECASGSFFELPCLPI
jgi:hypothetical protein